MSGPIDGKWLQSSEARETAADAAAAAADAGPSSRVHCLGRAPWHLEVISQLEAMHAPKSLQPLGAVPPTAQPLVARSPAVQCRCCQCNSEMASVHALVGAETLGKCKVDTRAVWSNVHSHAALSCHHEWSAPCLACLS